MLRQSVPGLGLGVRQPRAGGGFVPSFVSVVFPEGDSPIFMAFRHKNWDSPPAGLKMDGTARDHPGELSELGGPGQGSLDSMEDYPENQARFTRDRP